MTATATQVLARLRLVQGRSDSELREFVHARSQLLLTVGADPACDWCIQEAGVASVHFSLHWDGSVLRVSDTHGAGTIRVDGMPLGPEWRSLPRRARIEFGRAAIVVETSDSAEAEIRGQRIHRSTLRELSPLGEGTRLSPGAGSGQPLAALGAARAGLDQRTLQGAGVPAHAVRVTTTQQIAATDSGSPRSQPPLSVPPAGQPSRPPSGQPLGQAVAFSDGSSVQAKTPPYAPGTGVVMYREDASSGRSLPPSAPKSLALANQAELIPGTVVVLSPLSAELAELPETPERPSVAARRNRSLAGWRPITLGLLALGAGYLSWVYLLYHL